MNDLLTLSLPLTSPFPAPRYRSLDSQQPNDFLDEQYSLRQILYETPRRTELFIVMTMYNVCRGLAFSSAEEERRKAGGRRWEES